jgi:hypothetical protein
MEKYNGKLGAGQMFSDKPVVLFDDFHSTFQEFGTVEEAILARDQDVDQWACTKKVFKFNPTNNEYEFQA